MYESLILLILVSLCFSTTSTPKFLDNWYQLCSYPLMDSLFLCNNHWYLEFLAPDHLFDFEVCNVCSYFFGSYLSSNSSKSSIALLDIGFHLLNQVKVNLESKSSPWHCISPNVETQISGVCFNNLPISRTSFAFHWQCFKNCSSPWSIPISIKDNM